MFKKYKIVSGLIIIFLYSGFNQLNAQTNTLYYMNGVQQSLYLNPAYQSDCNFTLGLPAISGINIVFDNNAFSYNNWFQKSINSPDTLILNFNNVKNQLNKNNYINFTTAIPIIDLGFWIKNSYFTFSITNKTDIALSFPYELVELAIEGNGNYIGANNPMIIDNLGLRSMNYHEFAFGLSKQITHRLFLGARLKLLFGTSNIDSQNSEIKITTAEDTYAIGIDTDISLNLSGPFSIVRDSSGLIEDIQIDDSDPLSYALTAGNMGLAIDMGATYKFNDHFDFYASVTDLGFINWGKNVTNLTQKESYTFTGLSLDSIGTNYNEFNAVLDSLDRFTKFKESNLDYTRMLNAKVFLGATYSPADFMNFGFLSKTTFIGKNVLQAFTLSANFHPAKWFSGSLSYTAASGKYNNFGLGMAVNAGAFQIYMLTDNLNSALWPKDAKSLALQLGINLTFGCGKRDDYSIINNKKLRKDVDFL
ncbi:MAG: DUF5723 family protein [Bacteroidales bacterium]|nr:DUF5723 family protein [Bacteroidales bacterium]